MDSGLSFTVTVQGSAQLEAKLNAIGQSLNEFSKEMAATGNYLQNFVANQVFETEGQVIDERWAPLSTKYQQYKQNTYRGRGTLERTGAMRRGFRWSTDGTTGTFDNPTPYLVYHQLGTSKMPKRVIYKITQALKDAIVEIFHQGLQSKLSRL